MKVTRVLAKLEPGGAQLALLRLSRELLRRHGVTTRLVVGDATPAGLELAESHGLKPIVYRTAAALHPEHNLQWQQSEPFARWLADKLVGSTLVHAHMVGAWWAVAQVIPAGVPFIATEHNEVSFSAGQLRSLAPAAARVDRFYAMGPAAADFARAAGVPADRIHGARSPVAGLSARPGPGLAAPRLTFTGRLAWDKGPDVLVEALALLDRPELTAYLVGDGPLRASLLHRVRQLGLSDRVRLPGWTDKPWCYVAGSTVHIVPSREEAWSQSAVLALGLGVPVVGTAVDGLRTTLSQSRGLLVPPADPRALSAAIAEVLDGRGQVDSTGALRYARMFTPARIADFYLAEYRFMLTSAVESQLPELVPAS